MGLVPVAPSTVEAPRGMEFEDMPLVRKVQAEAARDNFRFHALVSAVVKSEACLNNAIIAEGEVGMNTSIQQSVLPFAGGL
jgi:hypothetical protein